MYKAFGKRLIDIIVSLTALLLLSPILIFVAIALLLTNKNGKILFYQSRPGLNGSIFKIVKFKTMTDETGPDGKLLPDLERITFIGKWIRRLSLDELLQLVNVLKGDMSLVGPRPLLVDYMPYYNSEEARRHDVRPGITGLAQINGRNVISWRRRLRYDTFYVKHLSLALDMMICFKTIAKVLKGSDEGQDYSSGINRFDDYIRKVRL
jgi:lipopolysaccharide/colanic/teichoic acid biosynthesis glycosyltransferase